MKRIGNWAEAHYAYAMNMNRQRKFTLPIFYILMHNYPSLTYVSFNVAETALIHDVAGVVFSRRWRK